MKDKLSECEECGRIIVNNTKKRMFCSNECYEKYSIMIIKKKFNNFQVD